MESSLAVERVDGMNKPTIFHKLSGAQKIETLRDREFEGWQMDVTRSTCNEGG